MIPLIVVIGCIVVVYLCTFDMKKDGGKGDDLADLAEMKRQEMIRDMSKNKRG